MPPDLQTLVDDEYLDSSETLTCSASGEPYVYVAASMSSSDVTGGTVIAYSTFKLPEDMRVVLLGRGRCEWMPVDRLRTMLRDQRVPENLIP